MLGSPVTLMILKSKTQGVSVKFLMAGETNSMVGYHLMVKDHSIELGVWGGGAMTPTASAGQCPGGTWNFLKKFLNIGLKKDV